MCILMWQVCLDLQAPKFTEKIGYICYIDSDAVSVAYVIMNLYEKIITFYSTVLVEKLYPFLAHVNIIYWTIHEELIEWLVF